LRNYLKYQDYYKNRTERLKRPKRRKKDRCGDAKKKIEDKFLQIYLNKDLLTGEEVISNFSDADVESLRNGYLGREPERVAVPDQRKRPRRRAEAPQAEPLELAGNKRAPELSTSSRTSRRASQRTCRSSPRSGARAPPSPSK